MHLLYLVFNISAFGLGYLISRDFFRSKKSYVKPFPLLMSYLLISVPFILWDIYATEVGHWSFSSAYTLDLHFFNLPIEEVLFFFSVPYLLIACFEWLRRNFNYKKFSLARFEALALAIVIFAVIRNGGEYSWIVSSAALVTYFATRPLARIYGKVYYLLVFMAYAFFFFGNTILTAPPVVSYGESFISGIRVLSIPLEDFLYNYSLIIFSVYVYDVFLDD